MAQPPRDGAPPAGRQESGDLEHRVRAIAAPLAEALGVELVEVNVKGYTGRRVVRLVVDAEPGIDVETCAALSRSVGAALDDVDAIPGRYTLEVTSPGIDRPLRSARDFRRNIGRWVRVVIRQPDRNRELIGTLTAVEGDTLALDAGGEPVAVPLTEVEYGRVQLPW